MIRWGDRWDVRMWWFIAGCLYAWVADIGWIQHIVALVFVVLVGLVALRRDRRAVPGE